jgi:hypothetical protein
MPKLIKILPEAYEKHVKHEGVVNAWNDLKFKKAIESAGRKTLSWSASYSIAFLRCFACNSSLTKLNIKDKW